MKKDSIIIGVDLDPINPIPGVTTLQGDSGKKLSMKEITSRLKTLLPDTVLHDGAPPVGTS